MVYIALAQCLVIAFLVLVLLVRERENDAAIKWMVETEAKERQTLLHRIQHPDRLPPSEVRQSHPRPPMDPEIARAYAAVGTVAPPGDDE